MDKIPATVLMTTANLPPAGIPYLDMTNRVIRKITAKAALYFCVAQGIEKMVLADATGKNLLAENEIAEIESLGTQIEQINYQQETEEIVKKGKGYGEGKLIEYAIDHSKILEREDYFFKCTGKTYVRNFRNIFKVIQSNHLSNIFWIYIGEGNSRQPWADCRFYYTSKDFAKKYLIPAYLKADDNIGACEFYIFKMLNKNKYMDKAKVLRPLISGFAGFDGKEYFDLGLGDLDYNFPCWATQLKNTS